MTSKDPRPPSANSCSILVDAEVQDELEREAKRTAVTINLVLRRLLSLDDRSHGGHG